MEITNPLSSIGQVTARAPVSRQNAKDEFQVIFYKEILKQAFTEMSDSSSAFGIGREIFLEKMARELAHKNAGLVVDENQKK